MELEYYLITFNLYMRCIETLNIYEYCHKNHLLTYTWDVLKPFDKNASDKALTLLTYTWDVLKQSIWNFTW